MTQTKTVEETEVQVLKAVRMFTKNGAYAGSMREKAKGAAALTIIEFVGLKQGYGVVEANQSFVKLLEGGYVFEEEKMVFLTGLGARALSDDFAKAMGETA